MLNSIESQGIGFEFNALLITLKELFISGGINYVWKLLYQTDEQFFAVDRTNPSFKIFRAHTMLPQVVPITF